MIHHHRGTELHELAPNELGFPYSGRQPNRSCDRRMKNVFIAYGETTPTAGLDLLPRIRSQALDLRALQHTVGIDGNLGERLITEAYS